MKVVKRPDVESITFTTPLTQPTNTRISRCANAMRGLLPSPNGRRVINERAMRIPIALTHDNHVNHLVDDSHAGMSNILILKRFQQFRN